MQPQTHPFRFLGAAFWRKRCGPHPLVCRLLITNPELRKSFAETIVPTNDYKVWQDLQAEDTAARQALRHYPLDWEPIGKNDKRVVHLVIVGLESVGRSLAMHAMRISHFANEVGRGVKFRLTIFCSVNEQSQFFQYAHHVGDICDIIWHIDVPLLTFEEEQNRLTESGDLVTYALCLRDAQENFRRSLELAKKADGTARILVHQTTRRGFAAALDRTESRGFPNVHPFGMTEDILGWDVFLRESDDDVARSGMIFRIQKGSLTVVPRITFL